MEKKVDVRGIIASRNRNALRWIPGFFIRYIQGIIHEDEVNAFFIKHEQADAYTFSEEVLKVFDVKLDVKGLENVPPLSEPCYFASNHPLGGFDALAVILGLRDKRPDIKFIVNDFLLYIGNLKERFIGVNKLGKNAAESLRRVEEQFASDTATFVFPAGLVSRKQKGVIKDLEWKKTFISKAKKYRKPIVPVYVTGQLTNRFYRMANFRKKVGIKFNFEMFFLVDELFRQKGITVGITFGKPIDPDQFDKSKSDHEWAQWMKEEVYKMDLK